MIHLISEAFLNELEANLSYGLRPEISNEPPQVLKELIQKCWDENPENPENHLSEPESETIPLLDSTQIPTAVIESND
ncbi:hypothetical protein RCL_jg3280.t1 [Rhizophagus clarus]|uniref:Serine-threonine/tyrosine-protein kinase catalytic domain-containing protein n=1 Tax=Rhizophagus clarus TaxID=94130 RepID=A0A8H3R1U9_9GLOM|nr:hypothetical protein RCL_jg3280.t1 [Rhizophagus clarus]